MHAFKKYFARPAAVVGISGLIGGTLGFFFAFLTGLSVFILLHIFMFLVQKMVIPESDNSHERVVLLLLAAVLGIYCMSLICVEKSRAEFALQNIHSESSGDRKSVLEGYICSVSLADEKYNTYTLLWKKGVKVRFGSSRTDLFFGQHVRITGYLSNIPALRNPGGFDQNSYYGRQGIFLSLETFDNNISILNDSEIVPRLFVRLQIIGLTLREDISSMWTLVLEKEEAALLSGMILGDTTGMSSELKNAFRMCNLAHLTAVSGANVAYFLVPASAFINKLSGRRVVRCALILSFLIFFGFLTGWSASVTRALFMSAGTIFSSVLMKRHDPISAMFLTSIILMFNNPFICVDLGFLLSFSATLSLVLFSDKLADKLHFLPGKEILPKGTACLICTQLGMLPWLIMLSGRESVLLFLTNLAGSFLSEGISLMCIPLSGCLLAAKVIPFLLPLVKILYLPLAGLLYVLEKMAYLCSNQSIHALRLSTVEPILLFAVSGLALSFLIPRGFFSRNLRRGMCILICVGILIQLYSFTQRPMGTVIFADVGQGDSALILLDNGRSVLIDGGDTGSAKNVLIPMLNYYGIIKPDITILTHLHRDHGMGVVELIEAGRVSTVYTSCISPNTELDSLFELEKKNIVTLHSIQKDDKIVVSEAAALYVLSPGPVFEEGGNEDSAVILFCIGSTGVLFMGDAGETAECSLLTQKETMNRLNAEADFLKVGHHGSKFSSSQKFLSTLSIEAAVISVGPNSYGHPTDDTLTRLTDNNIDIFRTDESGAVILEINKKESLIYKYNSKK